MPRPISRVGRVGPVRHPHPVQEVADRQGQRVLLRRDQPHRLDLRQGHRRAPVGQQLAHGGVELLVAHAARHQQVGVVLALRQPGAQPVGVLEEPLPRRDHEPLGGRHHLAPGVERRQHVVLLVRGDVGREERGVRDVHGDLTARCLDLGRDVGGDAGRRRRADVVVARVAAELVDEERRVVVGDDDDRWVGPLRHSVSHPTSIAGRWCETGAACGCGWTSPTTAAASTAGPGRTGCAPCRASSRRPWPPSSACRRSR